MQVFHSQRATPAKATQFSREERMRTAVFFLCFWTLQRATHSVPASFNSGCSPELVTVKRGEALSLHCASHCPGSNKGKRNTFTWWRVEEEGRKRKRLSYTGAVITEDAATFETGGDYECKCGSNGPFCSHSVAVVPEVTFTASRSATHFGDVVDFSCTVEGYPTNLSAITNNYGVNINGQVQKSIGSFRTETLAVIQDVEEEDYMCSVEINYKGSLVAEEKRSLKIKLYNPPSILYTTEYVIHQESEFGQTGTLTCAVQTTKDSESYVTWWNNGEELHDGGKYEMRTSLMNKDVKLFQLHINDIQQTDIGSYLCQLSSDYNREDSQEAWVQVDFREEDKQSGSHILNGGGGGFYRNDGEQSSPYGHRSTATLSVVAVLLVLSVVAGLGTWGVVAQRRRRKMKAGKKELIDGCGLGETTAVNMGTGFSVSVVKRK